MVFIIICGSGRGIGDPARAMSPAMSLTCASW
jgi:hypothetical protein